MSKKIDDMIEQDKAKAEYNRIEAVCDAYRDANGKRPYLHDRSVDAENAANPNCWISMLAAARSSVHDRCEGLGIDEKALFGYYLA